ncbi:MAG TPA: general secretion pathway protein GspF [Deltaproteobacteria bacterium]|jgi:type II secretory pathway component PulF|nr:MAG: type II secretion system F family protein [Pseudomonadota bacterium]HBM54918.1 general secretion pathway protein GspF [Deltaproteobacteria bacterium]|tara:strand:- start:10217 stop:11428 length:1212 start_codon:yes stop_codon:yes gene_type:complete
MPLYQYQAFDQAGVLRKGSEDAVSESDLRQRLRSQQLYPKEIRVSRNTSRSFLPKRGTNYKRALTLFTRQFEVLMDATIPYDKALQLIIEQTENVGFKEILAEVRARVVEGGSLADALQLYPKIFPEMYVSMIRSGENSGNLGTILKRLADYYETQERLRGRLKSAMIYPAFMLVFSLLVVVFMVTYIVPKITQIFASKGTLLPLPTRILMGLSDFMVHSWYLVLIGLIILIFGFSAFLRSEFGKKVLQQLQLKAPLIGPLMQKVLIARFCQTLGTLLGSGVDLKTALEISRHVVVNQLLIEQLNKMIIEVNNKGIPLSAAMGRTGYFPDYVQHVVAIGEEAARVDELLERVANRMQEEVSRLLEGLTALLQPTMIVLMGGIVGFIALSVLLPMLNMNQLLGR